MKAFSNAPAESREGMERLRSCQDIRDLKLRESACEVRIEMPTSNSIRTEVRVNHSDERIHSAEVGHFLRQNGDALVAKWEKKIRVRLPSTTDATFADHLQDTLYSFLDEVSEGLKRGQRYLIEADRSTSTNKREDHNLPKANISDRVHRDYLFLESTVELADEVGASLSQTGMLQFMTWIFSGTAEAMEEHVKRDREQHRRSSFEYFESVAHDLGSPLAAARLTCELIARRGELDSHSSDVLTRSLGQLAELIEHSVTRLRITSDIDIRRDRVDVDELIEDIRVDSIVMAAANCIQITFDSSQLFVKGDHRLLRFSLTHLLRNAIQIAPVRGVVTVRSSLLERRVLIEIEVGCASAPPERLLVNSGEQVDRDRDAVCSGFEISKQVIEAQGGTFYVEALQEQGCIFMINLPSSPEREKV